MEMTASLYICISKAMLTPNSKDQLEALKKAGQPVVRIEVADTYDIGQEFFRWEIATAVAGSILGINAFNQPDVEASKIVTRQLTSEYEKNGKLPEEKPIFEQDGIKLFTDERNAQEPEESRGQVKTLWWTTCAPISTGFQPATTWRCWVTSR